MPEQKTCYYHKQGICYAWGEGPYGVDNSRCCIMAIILKREILDETLTALVMDKTITLEQERSIRNFDTGTAMEDDLKLMKNLAASSDVKLELKEYA